MGAARHEVQVYERSREQMFSRQNAELRANVHSVMLRLAIPMAQILEDCMATTDRRSVEGGGVPNPAMETIIEGHLATLAAHQQIMAQLLDHLRPLARDTSAGYEHIGNPTAAPPNLQTRLSKLGTRGAGVGKLGAGARACR